MVEPVAKFSKDDNLILMNLEEGAGRSSCWLPCSCLEKFKVQGSKLGVCPSGLFIIYGWAKGQ
jgi:hypothetical protein